jgi:hypothetical protein
MEVVGGAEALRQGDSTRTSESSQPHAA